MRRPLVQLSLVSLACLAALALLLGCGSKSKDQAIRIATVPTATTAALPRSSSLPPVLLGIDVLEERGFAPVKGKVIGLLTHPAGVNRRGERTLDVLRRVPSVKLVALFAPEHGFDGEIKAGDNFGDSRHAPTGLPIYSLHGKNRKPTKEQLKGLDAMVIDLQDIGSRSYTFVSAMRWTMEACFENNVEVIVLDRPNPLGGLKADGPPLDPEWTSYVGAFRVPYVHGLTIGELARLAKEAPGVMAVSEKVRARGRLTIVPMRGWRRAMLWPDTGLRWVTTSPNIPTYEAAVGYAMVGLGCQNSGWTWGIGRDYPFRGIGFPRKKPDEIIAALEACKIPGLRFVKKNGTGSDGKPLTGVYVEISDWAQLRPTEISFHMHRIAASWQRLNPFATLTTSEQRTFNIHVGSTAWYSALARYGSRVNVDTFISNWSSRAKLYQDSSKRYWLYQ